MTVRGTLKTDALAIGRIEVDFLSNPVKVKALAALVVAEQIGQPLGWTSGGGAAWSPETMQRLRELRDSMEQDLARHLFTDGAVERGPQARGVAMPGGLGEHLAAGASQV